jgi:glycine hydroxymethyltransferase
MIMCRQELAEKIDRAVFPGLQGGPHMHIIAAKAVCFAEARRPEFVHYQQRTVENARVLAEELMSLGWRVVSGGTDNHLVLVDVGQKGISGKKAEQVLDAVGIYCNKNTIPFDPRPPAVGSGIRLGTPGLTSRGMGPDEMRRIARLIDAALQAASDQGELSRLRQEVRELASAFPVPGISDRQL